MLQTDPPGDRRRADPRRLRAGAGERLAGRAVPRSTGTRARADPGPARRRAARARRRTPTTPRYDALNRVVRHAATRRTSTGTAASSRPRYNRAGGLDQVASTTRSTSADRLRRQGPARADRLRQRRDDPLRLRPADLPAGPAAQRALHPAGRRSPTGPPGAGAAGLGYDYDLAGNILTIRDRTPGSGIPATRGLGAPTRARSCSQRRRARPAVHLRPDLPAALGHRPRVRPPRPAATRGSTPPRHRPTPDPRLHRDLPLRPGRQPAAARPHRTRTGGFTRDFTVAADSNRLQRLTSGTTPYDYTYDANGNLRRRDHLAPLRAGTTPTGWRPSPPRPRRRAVGPRPLPLRRGRPAGEEAGPQAGRADRGHALHRRALRAPPLVAGAPGRRTTTCTSWTTSSRIALVRARPAHPDDRGPAVAVPPRRPPRQQHRRSSTTPARSPTARSTPPTARPASAASPASGTGSPARSGTRRAAGLPGARLLRALARPVDVRRSDRRERRAEPVHLRRREPDPVDRPEWSGTDEATARHRQRRTDEFPTEGRPGRRPTGHPERAHHAVEPPQDDLAEPADRGQRLHQRPVPELSHPSVGVRHRVEQDPRQPRWSHFGQRPRHDAQAAGPAGWRGQLSRGRVRGVQGRGESRPAGDQLGDHRGAGQQGAAGPGGRPLRDPSVGRVGGGGGPVRTRRGYRLADGAGCGRGGGDGRHRRQGATWRGDGRREARRGGAGLQRRQAFVQGRRVPSGGRVRRGAQGGTGHRPRPRAGARPVAGPHLGPVPGRGPEHLPRPHQLGQSFGLSDCHDAVRFDNYAKTSAQGSAWTLGNGPATRGGIPLDAAIRAFDSH